MGGIVRSVTDAVGLTDYSAADKSQKYAARASDNAARVAGQANELSAENIAFQREQYNDWKAIYGDLQENLSEYYNTLGTEKVIAFGLQEQQIAHQQAEKQIRRNMAQRGLGNSKFEAYIQSTADIDNSNRRAQIRATADERAAQHKLNFLGIGLNQGAQMLGNINNATNIGTNSLANQASMYNNQASMYNDQFGIFTNNNAAMMRSLTGDATGYAGVKYANKKE